MVNLPKEWTLEHAMSKPLTDDERRTLEGWNRHDLIQQNDEVFGGKVPTQLRKIDDGNTGDTDPFTADQGHMGTRDIVAQGHNATSPAQAERARQLAAGETDLDVDVDGQRDAEEELASAQAPADDDEDTDDTDEFSQMKNAELRDWLRKRDLPASGNRTDLLSRARQADAEA